MLNKRSQTIYVVLMLVIISSYQNNGEESQKCSFEESTGILKCSDLSISNNSDEMLMLNLGSTEKFQADQLIIENSTIPTLNLNFIEQNQLSGLSGISIRECNISRVVGDIPCHISSLRLSDNMIRNFSAVLLKYGKEEVSKGNSSETKSTNASQEFIVTMFKKCTNHFSLDLRNNLLEELPVNVVNSTRLKSLHLSGNPIKCEFIWETVWDHLECSHRQQECRELFVDQNSTNCQFYPEPLLPSGIFYYNLGQIFDSKISLEAECSEMNKTCLCHPFNLWRGEGGKPTVYLTVNCSGKNLTQLPKVSEYTWELNVSSNHIQDFSNLNDSTFSNLRILDLSDNLIDDLSSLAYTDFMIQFDLLYVNYNKIQKIPDIFLSKVKNSKGKGKVKLGSQLECECHSATSTKGRIIEIQNNIVDLNDLVCGNVINDTTNAYLKLTNLKLTEFCPIPNANEEGFDWMVPVIVLEILCIFGVILKVFYDWRNYRQTGRLPWIAEKLPRLPCDGILE